MQSFDAYIAKTRHFQPVLRVMIGGIDVTGRLVEKAGIQTDWILDTPELNVYTTSTCRFRLNNSDNFFDRKNPDNFFVQQGRSADGWLTPVIIYAGFLGPGAPDSARVLFAGYIESVTEMSSPRHVSVLLLDGTALLQRAVVDDFGETVRGTLRGPRDAPNYRDTFPVWELPANTTPVSDNSFTGRLGTQDLTILPTLPRVGRYRTYANAVLDSEKGQLLLGGEPPEKERSNIVFQYKAAYRYRTAEFLISELLSHLGFYEDYTEDEQNFAKTLLHSVVIETSQAELSSHGRVHIGRLGLPSVVRWIDSDLDGFYFGADRALIQYQRRDDATGALDAYTYLSACPDFEQVIVQFRKAGNTFYVKTVGDWAGRTSGKLWKVEGEVWTEYPNADPDGSQFYDYLTENDWTADNRKSFILQGGYLYYGYADAVSGVHRVGVRRVDLASGVIEPLFSETLLPGQTRSADIGVDFAINFDKLYVFLTKRQTDRTTHLRVYESELDGTARMEVFTETFDRDLEQLPQTVSDVVIRGSDAYFVLTYRHRKTVSGGAELCYISLSGGTRTVLKEYDTSLFSARSLVTYREDDGENIYFVEGQWLSVLWDRDLNTYPTHSEAGHLQKIDIENNVLDQGPVWESGGGMHTAFCSNLHRSEKDDTLHFISGYGMPASRVADTIQTFFDLDTNSLDNWVWLQFGKQLATKIPVLNTNRRTVWQLFEELAVTVDFEVGWTSGEDEITKFLETYPGLTLSPRGYVFFRPRSARVSDVVFDSKSHVGLQSELDTTLVANYVAVSYGPGVAVAKVPDLDDGEVRFEHLSTGLLSGNDFAWARYLAELSLERQKTPRLKTRSYTKFSPQLQLGQQVRVSSDWHSLEKELFQVTHIQQDTSTWQTYLELREEIEVPILTLPSIRDRVFAVGGQPVTVVLPEVVGDGTFDYSLSGLPVGLTFDAVSRTYSGSVSVLGEFVATYRAVDVENPARTVSQEFEIAVVDVPSRSAGIAISVVGVHLLDNRNKDARVFLDRVTRLPSEDMDLGAGDFFDMTSTGTHLVVLDKSGDANRLRFYSLSTGSEDGTPINLDADLMTGETAGDWRGVAYNSVDGLLYAMNVFGAVRLYNTDRSQNTSKSVDLNLCADWQAIAFRVEGTLVTFLTLTAGLPTVLGWDLSQPESGPARFQQKDIALHDTDLGWTGIDFADGKLYACRGNSPVLNEYDLG